MKIREFGHNKTGKTAKLYLLENANGMELHVTDFGATLQALFVPDKNGKKRDVVLGYDYAAAYEGPARPFFGATVGRHANRIANGTFTWNGTVYQLEKNEGNNNLHSGTDFWSFRIWDVKELTENSITFALYSPDGDQGYHGNVDAAVTYTLTDDNRVILQYHAVTDADTPINMTNHSYFNLSGHESGSICEHILWIDSDKYTRTDCNMIPTGEMISVNGTPMDFRVPKAVGLDISKDYEALNIGHGYDHNWGLNNHGVFQKVAEITSLESGISMEVSTDLPGIQIYTANGMDDIGKNGAHYCKNQGICFETQYYPDSMNHAEFQSCICKKDTEYQTKTEFRFLVSAAK